MQVKVMDGNLDKAFKELQKMVRRDGIFEELKERTHKVSDRRRLKEREAEARRHKKNRKVEAAIVRHKESSYDRIIRRQDQANRILDLRRALAPDSVEGNR